MTSDHETLSDIPEGLVVVLHAYLDDSDWLPPQGSPGLRAMIRTGGKPNSRDFEWIRHQEELIEAAAVVLQRVHEVSPMPSQEEVLDGGATWPTWVGTPWYETLMHPWSQNLDWAIEQAELYVVAADTEA